MNRWNIFFFSLFGIGFVWACVHFWIMMYSGEFIAEQQVFKIDEGKIYDQRGNSKARHNPDRYESMSVQLSPEMNTIGVYFSYDKLKRASGQSDFSIEVQSSTGQVTQTLPVLLRNRSKSTTGSGGSKSGTTSGLSKVGSFDVTESDEYTLRVIPGEKQGVAVTDLYLRIRRNAWVPPFENLVAAAVTSIFGMVCGIFSVLVTQTSKIARAKAAAAEATTDQN